MPQKPLPIIQISDHVAEQNIISPLSAEENTQSGNIVEDGAFDYAGWVDEQCSELVLDGVLEILEGCIV